jgi:hypothetical protein
MELITTREVTVVRPLDSFRAFYEPEGSIENSQKLSTSSYPEADYIQSTTPHPTSQRSILILSTPPTT